MFSRSNFLATLVTGMFFFLGGYLIWGMLTVDFFASHSGTATGVMKEIPDMFPIVVGCFLQAFFMSVIYSKWSKGVHSLKGGFQFGALLGAFTGFGMGILMLGSSNIFDVTGVLVEGVLEVFFTGVGGLLIALVHRYLAT